MLTNASIIEMVQLGFGESLIVEKIKQSKRNFDTSLAGLRALKQAQVGDGIIRAMMGAPATAPPVAASPAASVSSATPAANAVAPKSPADSNVLVAAPITSSEKVPVQPPGIYIREGNVLTEINPTTYTGAKVGFLGSALSYGWMKTKTRAKVRGASANMTTGQQRPSFYFYFDTALAGQAMAQSGFLVLGASSPAEFVLVRMERKSNTRETVIGEFNNLGASSGTRDKDIRDFAFEKVGQGIFKVTPKVDLEPGEYCFYYASTPKGLGFAGGKLFDFSIIN